tara:strand:- start:2557 stop:2751 length:195 start_codon:yes stop_codon:yes gene_type:complete
MVIYAVISLFFMIILIKYLIFRLFKLEKRMDKLLEENEKFKKDSDVKRNIGFDSIWKMVNERQK